VSDQKLLRRHSEHIAMASEWMGKLDRGLTVSEEARFKAWLFEEDGSYEVFMAMAKTWDRMDYLTMLATEKPTTTLPVRSRWSHFAVAAVLICGLFAWQQLFLAPQRGVLQSDQYAKTHETDKGERRDHQLPDGSRLSLNTNTRVGVQYSPEHRNLYLEQGEIHLRVESDPTRPLTVFAGARIFRAVGTEFNLEISDDQQIELVVTEGIGVIGVLAAAPDGDGFSRPMLLPDTGTFVSAGRELVVSTSSDLQEIVEAPEAIDQEDIAVKLSWRDGNLIFRGESLEEAIAEVGRYTEVEFVFLDETAKRQTVSGLFRAGDVDGLLLTLRNNFNITHELVAGDRVLLRTHAVD